MVCGPDSINCSYKRPQSHQLHSYTDDSSLILSKVDRLAEMAKSLALTSSTQPLDFFSNVSTSYSSYHLVSPRLGPPMMEFTPSYSSTTSKSVPSTHSAKSSLSEVNSPITIYTTQSRNSSNAGLASDITTTEIKMDWKPFSNTSFEPTSMHSDSLYNIRLLINSRQPNALNNSNFKPDENDLNDDLYNNYNDNYGDEDGKTSRSIESSEFQCCTVDSLMPPVIDPSTFDSDERGLLPPSSGLPVCKPLPLHENEDFDRHNLPAIDFPYLDSPLSTSPQTNHSNSWPSSLSRNKTISSTNRNIHITSSTMPSLVFGRMRSFSNEIPRPLLNQSPSPPIATSATCSWDSMSNASNSPASLESLATLVPVESMESNKNPSTPNNFLNYIQHSGFSQTSSSSLSPPSLCNSQVSANPNEPDIPHLSKDDDSEPVTYPSPARTVLSVSSNTSDSHISAQLLEIPSPLVNPISFTLPMSAVEECLDDEDDDSDSSFSKDFQKNEKCDKDQPQENTAANTTAEEAKDAKEPEKCIGVENRGHLLIRIEGLQDIQLPLAQSRRPKFIMTLDNGIEIVNTDPLPLNSTKSSVNQEFDLVVGKDLGFSLTFSATQDRPSTLILEETEEQVEQVEPANNQEMPSLEKEFPENQKEPEQVKSTLEIKSDQEKPSNGPKRSRFLDFFRSLKKKATSNNATSPQTPENQKKRTEKADTTKDETETKAATKKIKTANHEDLQNSSKKKPKHKSRDIWDGLVGPSGEFGRCYILKSQYEKLIFGRSQTFNLDLYNEWGVNEIPIQPETVNEASNNFKALSLVEMIEATNYGIESSALSRKKATRALLNTNEAAEFAARYRAQFKNQRPEERQKFKKVPITAYKIATLQITMMFIPQPNTKEKLPTSIKAAEEELRLVKKRKSISLEGYLSQEVGDCKYWRSLRFSLYDGKLDCYSKTSKKAQKTIELSTVKTIIDVEQMTHEEKLEMMARCPYYDRSFQLVINHGDVITLYADSVDSKKAWVRELKIAAEHCQVKSTEWTDTVLDQEETERNQSTVS